eukprot:TRINITY_DN35495_c0_g1_i1.p1 TRINITY_DN35495_c0_g1~~TRINITY_DN35495_c0_g1_i1.p1  ORF type:complete len:601 (-),score=113.72 TRINITY_DN35495_c0_g1_i1:190-1992(-)
MALQSTFHAQLKLLANEYELVCAENASLRKSLSLGPPPTAFAEKRSETAFETPKKFTGKVRDAVILTHDNLSPAVESSKVNRFLPGMLDADVDAADDDLAVEELDTKTSAPQNGRFQVPSPTADVISPTVAVPQLALLQHPNSLETAAAHENETSPQKRKTVHLADEVDQDTQQASRIMLLLDIVPALGIIVNGICTGVQADFSEPEELWTIVEYFFLVFFTVEILLKVYLFGARNFVWGRDWYWGWFDLFCVGAGLVEIVIELQSSPSGGGGVGGLLKLLKLARLGRIIRLLKFKIFAELKSMITGVFTGMKVLFWAIILLFLVMYIFGLAVRILFSDGERYPEFSNLPSAMFTVFRCFTEGCAAFDGTPLQERMRLDPTMIEGKTDVIFFFAYILTYLFVTVGIFNLIMAVFIDNVNDGSMKKKQHYIGASADKMRWILSEKFKGLCIDPTMTPPESFTNPEALPPASVMENPRTQQEFVLRSHEILEEMDSRGLLISKPVFDNWVTSQDSHLVDIFDDADIDVSMRFELFDVLDADGGGSLDFQEIITGLMRCRGPVSKVDIVSMGMKVRFVTQRLQEIQEKLEHLSKGSLPPCHLK